MNYILCGWQRAFMQLFTMLLMFIYDATWKKQNANKERTQEQTQYDYNINSLPLINYIVIKRPQIATQSCDKL